MPRDAIKASPKATTSFTLAIEFSPLGDSEGWIDGPEHALEREPQRQELRVIAGQHVEFQGDRQSPGCQTSRKHEPGHAAAARVHCVSQPGHWSHPCRAV